MKKYIVYMILMFFLLPFVSVRAEINSYDKFKADELIKVGHKYTLVKKDEERNQYTILSSEYELDDWFLNILSELNVNTKSDFSTYVISDNCNNCYSNDLYNKCHWNGEKECITTKEKIKKNIKLPSTYDCYYNYFIIEENIYFYGQTKNSNKNSMNVIDKNSHNNFTSINSSDGTSKDQYVVYFGNFQDFGEKFNQDVEKSGESIDFGLITFDFKLLEDKFGSDLRDKKVIWLGLMGNENKCNLIANNMCSDGKTNYTTCMENYSKITKAAITSYSLFCSNTRSYPTTQNPSCYKVEDESSYTSISFKDGVCEGVTKKVTLEAKCNNSEVGNAKNCYYKKTSKVSCPKGYKLKQNTVKSYKRGMYTCEQTTTTTTKTCTTKKETVQVEKYKTGSWPKECKEKYGGTYTNEKCPEGVYANSTSGCCKYYESSQVDKETCTQKKSTKTLYGEVTCPSGYTRKDMTVNKIKYYYCYREKSTKTIPSETVTISSVDFCPEGYIYESNICHTPCADDSYFTSEGNVCISYNKTCTYDPIYSCPNGYTLSNDLGTPTPYCYKKQENPKENCEKLICDISCPNEDEYNSELFRCILEYEKRRNFVAYDYAYNKCVLAYCNMNYSCKEQNQALQLKNSTKDYSACLYDKTQEFKTFDESLSECSEGACPPYCYEYYSNLGRLSCSLYDKSNTFTVSDNINQSSYTSCTNSQNRPSLYGKYITTFTRGDTNVNMYCREKASINLPGNVWNNQRTNSYFEWPASTGLNTMTSYLNYECSLFTEYENSSTNNMITDIRDVLKYLSFDTSATIFTGLKNTSTKLNVDYIDISSNDIKKYFNKNENVINIGNNIYATNSVVIINSNLEKVQSFNVYVGYKYTLPFNYNRYYNKITGKIETVTSEFTYDRNKGNINITIEDKGEENNKLKISTFKLGDITIENYTCKYDVGKSLVEECKCPSGTKNEYKSLPTSMGACQYLISEYCDIKIPEEQNACVGGCIKQEKKVKSQNIQSYDKICDGKKCDLEFSCINNKEENGNIKVCVKNYLYKKYEINDYLNIEDDKLLQALNYCDKKTCKNTNDSIIYRVIDLKNPFPGMKGTSRISGSNWSLEDIENKIINTNHKNVIYEITLTPNDIKKVREYNKKNSYNDFKMDCKSKDKASACLSKFLRENLNIQGKCKKITDEKTFYNCIK